MREINFKFQNLIIFRQIFEKNFSKLKENKKKLYLSIVSINNKINITLMKILIKIFC